MRQSDYITLLAKEQGGISTMLFFFRDVAHLSAIVAIFAIHYYAVGVKHGKK